MKLALPCFRSRRYLTGIDWSVAMLEQMTRRSCGVGNTSQVVIEIEGVVPEQTLRAALGSFLPQVPFLHGRIARDLLNLAPYWRKLPAAADEPLPFTAVQLPARADETAVLAALAEGVNRPLQPQTRHVSFLWLTVGESRSFLALVFDHRLLDARGAEMLLSLFLEHLDGRPLSSRLAALDTPFPAHLDEWVRRFKAGRHLGEHTRWVREGTIAVLERPARLAGPRSSFALVSFDREETVRIVETAYREAGYLMLQSFVLAAVLQALHPLFSARAAARHEAPPAENYVVPVTVDLRPPRDAEALLFFNHLSFVTFRIPVGLAADRAALAGAIREQMIAQVKEGLPQDLAAASDLMRIASLRLLSRMARTQFGGDFGSFSFAQLASATLHEPALLRGRMRNLFHMPRMPIPPAVGIVANQYAGRLNLTISAHQEVVTMAEIEAVAQVLRGLPRACAEGSARAAGGRALLAATAAPAQRSL